MPEKETLERAREEARQGKSPSTQAGEFVREEMHHVREGKHGAASTKQAIAIGLSKARRAGVQLPAPRERRTSAEATQPANRNYAKGQSRSSNPSAARSRSTTEALKKEGHNAGSHRSLVKTSARLRQAAYFGPELDTRLMVNGHAKLYCLFLLLEERTARLFVGIDAKMHLAHLYAVAAKTAEARKLLHDMENPPQGEFASPYDIASAYAGLDDC
jgi:hypothetical protein